MPQPAVRVKGLRELVRDFGKMDAQLKKDLQDEIKNVAKIVSDDVTSRASRFGPAVSDKIRPRVSGARGFVQSNARSKGIRPDFGRLLMESSFIPALQAKEGEVVRAMEDMLDRLGNSNGF